VTLALAYFRVDPLPKDLIEMPLEYFDTAIAWLKSRPSVDAGRLGVLGAAKGAEAALLLASRNPKQSQAIVAITPSSVVWEGAIRDSSKTDYASIKTERSSWSVAGKPLPFLRKVITPETKQRIEREGSADTIDFYMPALSDKAAVERARIPVERITEPVLLVASDADRMWPAGKMARDVCAAMRTEGGACEHLIYADAAHGISEPWWPIASGTYPAPSGAWGNPSLGGSAEGTVEAAADSWPKIQDFLEEHLKKSASNRGSRPETRASP
jgi:dienelactone hydrolase